MSRRYEIDYIDCPVNIFSPLEAEEELECEDGESALVIGDPWAAAHAIVGDPRELREFVHRLSRLVDSPPASKTSPKPLARATVAEIVSRLQNEPQSMEVWIEAPDAPDGFLPIDGQVYIVNDSSPAVGEPSQCLVIAPFPTAEASR